MRRPIRRPLALWIGVGLLSLLTAGLWRAAERRRDSAGPPGPGTSGEPGTSEGPALAWRWEAGKVYEFTLTYDVDGRTNVAALVAGGPDAFRRRGPGDAAAAWQQASTHGLCRLLVTPGRAGGAAGTPALVELTDLILTSTLAGRVMEGLPPAGATLAFGATLTATGGIQDLAFPPALTPLERNFARSVLSLVQVRLSPARAWRWDVEEAAPGGRYQARYAVIGGTAGAEVLTKTLSDAAARPLGQARPSTFGAQATRHTDGSMRVVFDAARGLALEVAGVRSVHVFLGDVPVGDEAAQIRLTLTGERAATAAPLVPAAAPGQGGDLEGTDELARMQLAQLRQLVGEATPAVLLAEVEAHPAGKLKGVQPAYERLIAYLTLHPEACPEVARELARLDPQQTPFEVLGMALTAVGSPEAQAALVQVMTVELRGDQAKIELLIPHLSMGSAPTPATEAYLRELAAAGAAPEVRGTARLALGSLAHQLLESQPERAAQIVRELGDSLAAAGAGRDRLLLLSSLGNIGHPEQTALVGPYLDGDDAAVRERAVHALRFVDTEEAHAALARKARTDPSDTVRARAVEALSFTPAAPGMVELYRGILRDERSLPVAKEAARNLFLMSSDVPAALTELKAYASRCAHPDLCPYVSGLVTAAEAARHG